MTDVYNLWAAGNEGTILHYTNGGMTGFDDRKKESIRIFSKIFPNPFDEEAKITYELDQKCPVSLKIFDIKGKELLTLVNGVQEKGKYTVKITGDKLTTGVYFYRLQTAKSTETRKIIKL
jgi:hypothetical protein